eukprot:2373442-Rhodomonas_salina.2
MAPLGDLFLGRGAGACLRVKRQRDFEQRRALASLEQRRSSVRQTQTAHRRTQTAHWRTQTAHRRTALSLRVTWP